jgi:hypothetical protein
VAQARAERQARPIYRGPDRRPFPQRVERIRPQLATQTRQVAGRRPSATEGAANAAAANRRSVLGGPTVVPPRGAVGRRGPSLGPCTPRVSRNPFSTFLECQWLLLSASSFYHFLSTFLHSRGVCVSRAHGPTCSRAVRLSLMWPRGHMGDSERRRRLLFHLPSSQSLLFSTVSVGGPVALRQ